MLTRAQKEEQVSVLKDKLGRATGVFVADYSGLSVDEVDGLRVKLRGDVPDESEYSVRKNSILRLAVAGTDMENISGYFAGPTAVAISYGDPVRVAKVLVECGKELDAFEIKGGYLDGNALDVSEVATLATLPSLLELRGKIVGLIQAPATKLVRLLSEPGGQLARLVDARSKSLGDGDES
ncbi:MAG: large subunit ribosomal protein L10 [Myxococcota bacterium]